MNRQRRNFICNQPSQKPRAAHQGRRTLLTELPKIRSGFKTQERPFHTKSLNKDPAKRNQEQSIQGPSIQGLLYCKNPKNGQAKSVQLKAVVLSKLKNGRAKAAQPKAVALSLPKTKNENLGNYGWFDRKCSFSLSNEIKVIECNLRASRSFSCLTLWVSIWYQLCWNCNSSGTVGPISKIWRLFYYHRFHLVMKHHVPTNERKVQGRLPFLTEIHSDFIKS